MKVCYPFSVNNFIKLINTTGIFGRIRGSTSKKKAGISQSPGMQQLLSKTFP